MAYLSFDIGSSSVKAALISEEGQLLGLGRRALQARQENTIHEERAEDWITSSFEAGREAIAEAGKALSRPPQVRALAVSGNGPTLVAIEADGTAMGPALAWMDRRAAAEARELSVFSGRDEDPSFYLPKALYIWRNADETARRRLAWFISCPEYLAFALSGQASAYLPQPGYKAYVWEPSLIADLGLPLDRFPPFIEPGALLGNLRAEAASRLGLDKGLPVVAGYPDFLASIVGAGAVDIGLACDRSGSSEALNICASRPAASPRLFSLPHAITGLWNVSGGVSSSGSSLAFVADMLGIEVPELVSLASKAAPGSRQLGFLPYLAGERAPLYDPERRAAFYGMGFGQGREELCRAVCEGICFGLRLARDLAAEEGLTARSLLVSGSAAREDFLCELKAQILGMEVLVPAISDCELTGDACAMAVALGDASNLGEAARRLVHIDRRFPSTKADSRYEEGFAAFTSALSGLSALDHSRAQQ